MTSLPDADLRSFDQLSAYLQEITEALAASDTERRVIEIVLTPAVQALGAVAGIVLLVDHTDQQMKIAGSQGYEDVTLTVWQEGHVEDHLLIADILRMREALYFEYAGALKEAYPELESRTGALAAVANAALPMFLDHRPLGVIVLDFTEPHTFTPAEQRFLTILSAQCAVALGRAEATRMLEVRVEERTQQLEERTRQLEEERAALDAFVAFSETVGTETDGIQLAGRAVDVLQVRFANSSGGYYQREDELWKLRTWTSDLDARPEFLAILRAGLPSDIPSLADLLKTREPTFTENWSAKEQGIEESEMYGSTAAYPVVLGGEVQGFLSLSLKSVTRWAERDRAIFRSVGQGLDFALERAGQAARLERQTEELDARTRALEGFADLTRDLSMEVDPYVLVRRAQEVVLSLLPEGYALYFELEGNRWVMHSQTGDVRSDAIQAVVDTGLPYDQANNLLIPYHSRAPYYQDLYARDTDNMSEMVDHIGASATLPIIVNGRVQGVFAVVLFGKTRPWARPDQAALESVVRSLGLALERATSVALLAQRTGELERSNAELEQFAYIASHDLQAPIRAVTSFAGLMEKRYGPQLDERARRYLHQIMESGEHMKRLVDELLTFSRINTERRNPSPVNSVGVFDTVCRRLHMEIEASGASVTRGDLPVVLTDAQEFDKLLQNLISNGLKYHREGVVPQIHVSAERDGEMWRFAVSDNGLGIEPEYFERIFVIFQRLHGQETYEGTGIGLAVCKKVVEKHGGRLWLTSTPGEGSTFFFTLPSESHAVQPTGAEARS